MRPLTLSLRIHDHEPAHPAAAQIWRGGATDLVTRSMIDDPPLWLLLAEHPPGDPAPHPETPPSRWWELEQINPGDLPSPAGAGGVILVSMNVDPEHEEEFNDWYNLEHIPHFNRLPGVIAARRFRAISGQPRYVALYHVRDTAIYATPGWMAANETPWILRMRRFQCDRTYFMFRQRIA